MINFITSFNKELFNSYAYRFLETFEKYAPNDCSLIVMYEGNLSELSLPKFQKINLIKFSSDSHNKFLKFFGNLKEARGYKIIEKKTVYLGNQLEIINDFRYDAIRFSFKIFVLNEAIKYIRSNAYITWIDSDVVCLKSFQCADLLRFMPDKSELMSYLGRTRFPQPNPYSECGFLGFNQSHPNLLNFLSRVEEVYVSGEIFSLLEWHDSWVWDHVRNEFEEMNIKFKNLSSMIMESHHPFVNCGLGEYFDHLKGPERKKLGRSFIQDYIQQL